MEKCKFCEAELKENSSVCPKCGKDNAEAPAAAVTEEVPAAEAAPASEPVPAEPEAAEKPAEKKLSAGKTIFVLALIAVVVVLVAAVVMNGRLSAAESEPAVTEAVTEVTETEPPTVPADGNPDDATCKGTYTADDEAVIAARDTVVATAGDHELTLGQLQVFYWMQVRNFMTQYGAYAAYFGLDIQQSLDTQMCQLTDTSMTWQQYFLASALNAWANYATLAAEAEVNGFVLPENQQAVLDNVEEDVNSTAVANGFESGEAMIKASLGNAAGFDEYRYFMETYYKANGYFYELMDSVEPTAEELEAFFEEHADDYAQSGITKESKSVDVRHILVYPEGAETAASTEELSEEAWAAGEAAAQDILNQWLEGDATAESFAALANEFSQDPGSNTNGGLYEGVTEGQMVAAFNDWCFDAERKEGDTGIVRTEYGYHVMYFCGSHLLWEQYAKEDFARTKANETANEIVAASPLTVKYDAILLANAELT